MYTTNIYRLDEVKAALQYSIHNKNSEEAIFWANELIISNELDELKNVLFVSWFHSIGLGNIEILYKILSVSDDELLNVVYGMTMLKESMRDCTMPVMFLYGIANKESKVSNIQFVLPSSLIQANQRIDTFIKTVLLGKYLAAWFLYVDIPDNILKNIIDVKYKNVFLKQLLDALHTSTYNKWYVRCAFIAMLCTREEILLEAQGSIVQIDNENKQQIVEFNKIKEKRKRRCYTVPRDCLYGKTKRGTMTFQENNIHELYDPDYILENSSVFEGIEDMYGSMDGFKLNSTARNYEDFMEWYFPDDIPDEWSLEDQQKSHGIGVNQSVDKPNLRRYFNRWVNLKSTSKIWDKETVVMNAIEKQDTFTDFYIENECFTHYVKKEKEKEEKTSEKEKDIFNFKSIKLILSMIE